VRLIVCLMLFLTSCGGPQDPAEWARTRDGGLWYANYKAQFGMRAQCRLIANADQAPVLGLYALYLDGDPPDCFIGAKFEDGRANATVTTIALYGLMSFNEFFRTGEQSARSAFFEQADRLVAMQRDGRWEWNIDVPSRELRAPWISGLSQSLGVSILLRAHQHSGDRRYLQAAHDAFRWLATPISEGGVAVQEESGTWLEEYPNVDRPSHVLNGHLWALFGVWDYYRATGKPEAKKLFDNGVAVLRSNIAQFDVGYWIVYDALNQVDFVDGRYMAFIVEQLRALHAMTGDKTFLHYADKWETYQKTETLFAKLARDEYQRVPWHRAIVRDLRWLFAQVSASLGGGSSTDSGMQR
jgi:hypothetical protein